MRVLQNALTIAGCVVLSARAMAAPHEIVECPRDIRAEVTTPLPAGWVATPQSSRPVEVSIENLGGQPALFCKYRMFGTLYAVWRRAPEGWPACRPNPAGQMSFSCYAY